jgi:hypothetical protein
VAPPQLFANLTESAGGKCGWKMRNSAFSTYCKIYAPRLQKGVYAPSWWKMRNSVFSTGVYVPRFPPGFMHFAYLDEKYSLRVRPWKYF